MEVGEMKREAIGLDDLRKLILQRCFELNWCVALERW